jgi:hypothetical protein
MALGEEVFSKIEHGDNVKVTLVFPFPLNPNAITQYESRGLYAGQQYTVDHAEAQYEGKGKKKEFRGGMIYVKTHNGTEGLSHLFWQLSE